jgi:hypothetical protein
MKDTMHCKHRKIKEVAERVGFEPLNAEPCTALHCLVRPWETKHLSGFRLPPELIDVF